jgi:hypothetical protein
MVSVSHVPAGDCGARCTRDGIGSDSAGRVPFLLAGTEDSWSGRRSAIDGGPGRRASGLGPAELEDVLPGRRSSIAVPHAGLLCSGLACLRNHAASVLPASWAQVKPHYVARRCIRVAVRFLARLSNVRRTSTRTGPSGSAHARGRASRVTIGKRGWEWTRSRGPSELLRHSWTRG